MSRLINRLSGRVFGWFDSKDARSVSKPLPAKFNTRARLALENLEARDVPATFTVLNTADSGAGSLRQAILDANSAAGDDTIEFNTIAANGTDFDDTRNIILCASALPSTTGTAGNNLTILGPGADRLAVSPTATGFHCWTLTAGTNTIDIRDFTISGFSASTGIAGGIEVLTNVFVAENMYLLNNTMSAGSGGALALRGQSHTLRNCTIVGNSTGNANGGGGAWVASSIAGSTTTILNSTIANNTGQNGGGLSFQSHTGSVTIDSSTITNNKATTTTTTAGFGAGGIGRQSTTGALTVSVTNSIIANNTSSQGRPDLAFNTAGLVTVTSSLIGAADTYAYTDGGGNKTGTAASPLSPQLSILGYQGGSTPVHVPLGVSPPSQAIGAGVNSANGKDQTGATRASPFDMGSFEVTSNKPFAMIGNLPPVFSSPANPYQFSVTLYDDAGIDVASVDDGDEFRVTGPNGFNVLASFVSVSPAGNGTPRVATYQFNAPGGTWDFTDDGFYAISLEAGQILNTNAVAADAGFEGGFFMLLPAPTPPAGALSGNNNLTTAGGTTHQFTVTYTDSVAMSAASFGDDDVRVTGPNSFNQVATKVSVNTPGDGTPRIVTYQITAPGGIWDATDVGTYTVSAETGKIANTSGLFVPAGSLGTFNFEIAQVFNVTNANDSGAGSLRQAILDANATSVSDIINFDPTFFNTPRIINFASEVAISKGLTINGPGADKLTLSGGNANRIFNVTNGATGAITVAINNLAITGGSAATGGGGAILNADEAITLDGVYGYGNKATGVGGFINNATAGYSLTVRNSTITGNSATTNGGAAYFSSLTTPSSLIVINSTVSFNTATSTAGAFYFLNGGAATTTQLRNSTFVGNSAATAGFLRTTATTHIVTVDSSIISNTGPAATPDFSSSSVTATNSAISSTAGFTTSSYTGGVAQGTPLASLGLDTAVNGNGGAMPTLAILGGSPLINTGANTQGLVNDQRGVGFAREAPSGQPDIGAFERDPTIPSAAAGTLVNIDVSNAGTSNPYVFTITYSSSDPVQFESVNDGDEIRVTGPNGYNQLAKYVSAAPASDAVSIVATYKITPPLLAGWNANDNGKYSVTIEANQVKTVPGKFVPAGTLGSFSVGFAKTYTVTNVNDSGPGSLRQAILDANAAVATKDTIIFDPSVFNTPQTITLAAGAGAGQMAITDSLVITGPDPITAPLTLNANFATRHFVVNGSGTVDVTFSNLTFFQGSGSDGAASLTSATGGSILVSGDELVTIDRSSFFQNRTSSTFDGGAVSGLAGSKITVRNSTFSGNSASVSAGGDGGAIASNGGNLTVENSSFTGNTATGRGGAIYFTNSTAGLGLLTVRNSTLSGNNTTSAAGAGGAAIMVLGSVGTTSVANSTIVNNVANTTATTAGFGGALAVSSATLTVNVESTILSGNFTGSVNRPDLSTAGTVTVINSAIGVNAGFTLSGSSKNNLNFGANLNLGALQDNGGGILTHLPAADSVLVDRGTNSFGLTTDQRGLGTDTVNFPRSKGTTDIGAVEVGVAQNPAAFITLTNVGLPENGQSLYTFTVKYSDALSKVLQSSIDSFDIRISGPNGFDVLATKVSTDQPGNFTPINATYSFVPPDNTVIGKWDPSDNGLYTATMEANQVQNTNGLFVPSDVLGTFNVAIPQTYVITTTADSGAGSLRQAILDSNASVGATDTILFDPTVFATPQTITLGSEIAITDGVTINGAAANGGRNIISGGGATRIFNIDMPGIQTVNFSNLKLTSASSTTRGGAVLFLQDTLNFTDCDISDNTNTGNGGAIGGAAGGSNVLNLTRVTAMNNKAATGGFLDLGGGGGTVTVTDSTISNNTGTTSAGAFATPFVNLTVTNSTISGNSAAGGGGAFQFVNGGTINVINSTISGNTTSGTTAGAAFNFASTASYVVNVNIRNSTITLNSNTTTGVSAAGGIHWANTAPASNITINSTIIAGNLIASTSTTSSPDIRFSTARNIPGDNNLIGVSLTSETNATFTGSNPLGTAFGKASPLLAKLSPLSGNGGLTQTHALQADSPAIDAGNNITPTLSFDQRGSGFPRLFGSAVDIGAFERDPSIPGAFTGTLVNINNVNAATNDPYTFTVTYTGVVDIDFTTTDDSDEIRVTGPNGFNKLATFVSATPSATNATSIVATYTFAAPLNPTSGWDGDDNGTYTISVEPNQVSTTGGKFVPGGSLGTFTVAIPAIYTVSNDADSGTGSLRQAILNANANSLADIIVFDPAYFSTPRTILTSTELAISEAVTITGPGAAFANVKANGAIRLFNTSSAAAATAISISGLTVSGAAVTGSGGGVSIGDENVTLTSMVITGNSASAGGGAVYTLGAATLTISKSELSNNTAGTYGGAVFTDVAMTLNIDQSTLSGNISNGASFGGGAMYITGGTTTITNSTLSGNSANGTNGGGAFYTWSTPTAVVVSNSTIANNTAKQGGGIRIQTGPLTLRNSTVVGNSAITAATSGGGLSFASTGTITIESTVVAGNTAAGVANDFHAAGTNSVNVNNSAWSTNYTPSGTNLDNLSNVSFAAMGLGALANNGGLTLTMAPGGSSILLNKGSNSTNLTLDQRGFARTSGGQTDIGAVEADPSIPTIAGGPYVTINAGNAAANNPYSFTVTYASTDLIDGTSIDDGDEIRVTGPNGFNQLAQFVSASPTGNAASIVATYKVSAPIGGWTQADNGTYSVALEAGQVKTVTNIVASAAVVNTFKVAFTATYIVTNTNDSGGGSLRQALLDANANAGLDDTILFEATTFSTPQTITLTSGALTISDGVFLNGPGKNLLTINGNAAQSFVINNGIAGNAINVTIQDLKVSGSSFAGLGGAVSIQDENVTFLRTILENNTATTGGGAINVVLPASNSTLSILDSVLQNNAATTVASGDGGAIRMAGGAGYLIVRNSTVANNSAMDDGGAFNLLTGNSLLVENSTLSGNAVGGSGSTSTTPDGAAIYFIGNVGPSGFNIRNATISGNTAGPGGGNTTSVSGALGLPLVNGTFTIQNSTIAENASNSTSLDAFDGGGGIAISNATGGTGKLVLESTIVAKNTSLNSHPDISAQNAVSLNFSAVGSASGFTLTAGSQNNLAFGVDLKLGAFGNNGGIVSTYLPAADSPLIDRGSNPAGLLTDARGGGTDTTNFPRTKAVTDIGAVEAGVSPAPFGVTTLAAPTVDTTSYTFTVTYYDAITGIDVSSVDDGDEIRVTGPNGFDVLAKYVSIDNATNGSPRTVTYSFTAPGGTWDADNDNGLYTFALQANQVKSVGGIFASAGDLGTLNVTFPTLLKVSNTNDSGPGSLRQAVLDANTQPGSDVITFTSFFNTPQVINLTGGEMAINEAVTITGPGASKVTVSMGGSGRHFNTTGAPTGAVITISDMTLTAGSAATGGAIQISDEAVTLERMNITGNVAPNGAGIQVALAAASLTVLDSTVSNNSASSAGGGITILTTSTLLVERSTFFGNIVTTGNSGGAIRYVGAPGANGFTVRNSTFTANISGFNGGALGFSNLAAGSVAVIENCTIVGNTANSTGNGGGIGINAGAGTFQILNSIISDNVIGGTGTNGKDIFATTAVVNINTSAYSDTAGFTPTGSGNLIGQNLKLAPLANNGGFTSTMLPASDSPVVDSGSATSSLATDQRGFARLAGSKVDIGAVELQSASPVVTGIVVNNGNTQRSRLTQIVVNFQSPVDVNQFHAAGAVFLTRTGVPTNNVEPVGTVVNNTNGLIITPANGSGSTSSITLTFQNIDNAGLDFGSLSDGRWQLSIVPASYTSPNAPTDTTLRRLFGNVDNDTTVGATDFSFYPPFGAAVNSPFDFNNDGSLDSGDFGQFGNRYGFTLV